MPDFELNTGYNFEEFTAYANVTYIHHTIKFDLPIYI